MSISQNTYPKEIVLKGDSLICLTYNQQRAINADLERLQGCKVELDSTEKLTLKYELQLKDGLEVITNLRKQIELKSGIIADQAKIIQIRENENNKYRSQNKGLKVGIGVSIGVGVGAFAAGVIYGATK